VINKRSRYYGTETFTSEDPSGDELTLLELRAIPPTPVILHQTAGPADRLDHFADRYYRNPRKFWRICDASDSLDPFEIARPGAAIPIPPDK